MVAEINNVIKNLNYNINLSVEDVLSYDSEIINTARRHFEYLTYNDLNVCAKIIKKQGYEMFQVFIDCGGLTMSILPENKIHELAKYFD